MVGIREDEDEEESGERLVHGLRMQYVKFMQHN